MKKDFMKIDPAVDVWSPPPGTRGPGYLTWASFAPPPRVTAIGSEEPPSPVANDPAVPPRSGLSSCSPHPSLPRAPIPSWRTRETPLDGVAAHLSRRGFSSSCVTSGRGDCPGQFQRRSHRLHHVLVGSPVLPHIHKQRSANATDIIREDRNNQPDVCDGPI